MQKYSYPAVFTPEDKGRFSVNFPDLEGCYTCGDDIADAIIMAEDVLAMTLYDYEREHKQIPIPSLPSAVQLADGEFINYIACDTMAFRQSLKIVEKTVMIPEWLNKAAMAREINFSQVFNEALLAKVQEQ